MLDRSPRERGGGLLTDRNHASGSSCLSVLFMGVFAMELVVLK